MNRSQQAKTERFDAMASAGGEGHALDDALTIYLKQMGAIPMLRADQEQRLVRRLDTARRRYRRAVLSTWHALGRLLETFEGIAAGGQALERQIDVVPGLALTGDAVHARLSSHLNQLRRLRKQAESLFAQQLRGTGDVVEPRRRLRQRLQKAIRLAEALSPRTELVDRWAAELAEE